MWGLHAGMEPDAQAWVAGPVNTRPLAPMVWLDSTQAPGRFTPPATVIGLPLPVPDITPTMLTVLSAEMAWRGAIRWGRTHNDMLISAPVKTARVAAMAGTVRRMSTPRVTPRAKANAA